jgi:small subunit ribosomal protein S20
MEVFYMANIKSAKKRILTSNKKAEANKAVKTGVKSVIKNVRTAVESGDKAAAQDALKKAEATIDKAATKGVLHKNTAANKVSKLASSVAKMN